MIPLANPILPSWDDIQAELEQSQSSGKLTNFGPCYWRLVDKLADLTGRYDVPCTSGTAAIQLAAQSVFPRGSRVLMPDYTHVGTLQALIAAGMSPILCPVSRMHWTLSLGAITAIPRDKFDAMLVVSPFGYQIDFIAYDQIAKELGKPIVYDLAGAFGITVTTKAPVCYSFHATKNVPIGEGGVASFQAVDQADKAFRLSCFDQNKDRSIESPYGGNLKLDEIRCAIARVQLDSMSKIMKRIARKRELIDLYQDVLGDNCVQHKLHHGNSAPSLCVVAGLPAERIEKNARELGFEAKQYYPLLSSMRGLSLIPRYGVSSTFFRTCVALPSGVTDVQAKSIAKAVLKESKARRAKVLRQDE